MNNSELRQEVLLSAQRALLGMIYSSIRGIAIGFNKKKIKLIYYLDREPNIDDYENISEVTSEICADIEFSEVEEACIYTTAPISSLDYLDAWVYVRREDDSSAIG